MAEYDTNIRWNRIRDSMTNVPTVFHKFQEIVVSGAAVTSVTFSNLNINLDDLYVIHCTIKNALASLRNARIYINGDTTVTNYHSQYLRVSAGVVSAGRVNTPVFTDIQVSNYAYATINIMLDIAGKTRFMAECVDDSGAGVVMDKRVGNHNVAQANITSITIDMDAANAIGIGSQFLLLRLNRYG